MNNKKTTICGIVAIGPNNVIGRDGVMPWHSVQDLHHFKMTTTPYPCIFGKKTYDGMSIKPLVGRLNLVCSSQYKNEYQNGVFYANSVESALEQCAGFDKVFICGGGVVYKYALDRDLIDVMYITKLYDYALSREIKARPRAYTRFPIDIYNCFRLPKWQIEKIEYPENVLPVEKGNIIAEFFKSIRMR